MVPNIWNTCHRLPVAMALVALLVSTVVYGVAWADEEGSIVVDANSTPCIASNHHFTTIKDAVTFAAGHPGATINVCPGTYGEQVVLNTAVTLRGVTVPSADKGAAIITVPSTGLSVNSTVYGKPLKAQVLVQASNVTLSDLAIDGTGAFPSGSCPNPFTYLAGVDFDSGSSGQTRHLAVRNQNTPNNNIRSQYCENGIGILANTGAGEVTVRDSSVSNFDSAGIDGEVPIVVENDAVTQVTQNAIFLVFAYGVLLDSGVSPSKVTSNTIVAGLDVFCNVDCPGVTISNNDIVITSGGCGIYVTGVGATINENNLSGASLDEFGIMGFGTEDNITDNSMSTLGGNFASGTYGIGILLHDNSNDTVTGNKINEAGQGITQVNGNTVNGNTFHNVAQLTTP